MQVLFKLMLRQTSLTCQNSFIAKSECLTTKAGIQCCGPASEKSFLPDAILSKCAASVRYHILLWIATRFHRPIAKVPIAKYKSW